MGWKGLGFWQCADGFDDGIVVAAVWAEKAALFEHVALVRVKGVAGRAGYEGIVCEFAAPLENFLGLWA